MSKHHIENGPEGLPEATEADILDKEKKVGRRVGRRINAIRLPIYWVLAITGAILTATNVPDGVKRWMLNIGSEETPPENAKEFMDNARREAEKIVAEIFTKVEEIEAGRVVTDDDVRTVAKNILADKKVIPEEALDLLVNWQEEDLLAIARRLKGLENIDAAEPRALEKRLPDTYAATKALGPEIIRSHPENAAKWKGYIAVINDSKTNTQDVQKAGQAIRLFMTDVCKPSVYYSADAAVALSEFAGVPVTKLGRDRLVGFEKTLLGSFIVERHALIGQSKTMKVSLASVDRLAGLHTKASLEMKKFGFAPAGVDAGTQKVTARQARITAAMNELAKVLTVLEISNRSFSEPSWKKDEEKAFEDFFGKGNIPPEEEISAALRTARVAATDRVRAELNNDNPDCVEAEIIVRQLAYVAVGKDKTGEPYRRATNFLRRTEGSKDVTLNAARAMVQKLVDDPDLTPQKIEEAYLKFSKDHQETPFGNDLVTLLTTWAGKHKASFRDPSALTRESTRDNLKKSRTACATMIVQSMQELVRLKDQRIRWQSGYSLVQTTVDSGGKPALEYVYDPMTGNIAKDQLRQSKQGIFDTQAFLGELAGVHKLQNIDQQRDAAAATVRWIRKFMSVVDTIRLQGPQTAPQTIDLQEIVEAYDEQPLRQLLEAYENHLELLNNAAMGSFEKMGEDKKNSNIVDVHRHIAEYKGLSKEQLQALLQQKLTPSQRVAIRIAVERQRETAMRPFLTEEMAHLLALAKRSDEWSGIVGDMQRSKESWLNLVLFIIGIIMAYKGGKWGIGAASERRQASKLARAVYREVRDEVKAEMTTQTLADRKRLDSMESALEYIASPQMLEQAADRILAILDKTNLEDAGQTNARALEECSRDIKKEIGPIDGAGDVVEVSELRPTIRGQVRIRVGAEAKILERRQTLAEISDARATRPSKGQHRSSMIAFADTYNQMDRLAGALAKFTPDLPTTVPALVDLDIATADQATILLVAYTEGLDINERETDLRRKLLEKQKALPLPEEITEDRLEPPTEPPSASQVPGKK